MQAIHKLFCNVTTMTNISRYCRFFVAIAGLLLASTGFAQTKSDKPPAEGISAEIIQGRLKQVEDSHDLDESVKVKIREYYQQAMRELDSAQTWQAGATRFEQMATSAAADLAATKTELDADAGQAFIGNAGKHRFAANRSVDLQEAE